MQVLGFFVAWFPIETVLLMLFAAAPIVWFFLVRLRKFVSVAVNVGRWFSEREPFGVIVYVILWFSAFPFMATLIVLGTVAGWFGGFEEPRIGFRRAKRVD